MSQIKFFLSVIIVSLFINISFATTNTLSAIKSEISLYKESTVGESYVQTIILRFSSPQKEKTAKIEVAETLKTAGQLKVNMGFSPRHNHTHYTVKVTDEAGNLLFETEIEDPLNKTMEYVQDDGELMKQQAVIDEDYVAIRMNFEEAAKFLEIYHDHELISKIAL